MNRKTFPTPKEPTEEESANGAIETLATISSRLQSKGKGGSNNETSKTAGVGRKS